MTFIEILNKIVDYPALTKIEKKVLDKVFKPEPTVEEPIKTEASN